jgi:polar amino acid transport system substrate-binding protein
MRSPRTPTVVAVGLGAALALAGCTTPSATPAAGSSAEIAGSASAASSAGTASTSGTAGSSAATGSSGAGKAVAVDEQLAAQVPADIRQAGKVNVATDPTYPPFENVVNNEVVGLDADMANAIGDVLNLDVKFVHTSFDAIIPALSAKSADMALSSIGDNKEREKTVDFATYYWNGTLLLVQSGNPAGGTPKLACDMKVGVIRGSLQQQQFLPAQAAPCTAKGKKPPAENAYSNSNQAVLALQSSRIDGVLIDAPAATGAAKASSGALEAAGPILRNPNPGGVAFPKDSGLAAPVSGAINKLIRNGTYARILAKWGLAAIKIDKSTVNGALQ